MKIILTLALLASPTVRAETLFCEVMNPLFSCDAANRVGSAVFIEGPKVVVDSQRTARVGYWSGYERIIGDQLCAALGFFKGSLGNSERPTAKGLVAFLTIDGDIREIIETEADPQNEGPLHLVKTVTCKP